MPAFRSESHIGAARAPESDIGSEKSGVLTGVVPPASTPLTPDLEVDVPSLERLIDHLIGAGVHGVFVLGSTGEATGLTNAQRRTVIETAVRYVGGQVPVVAGLIDTSTARVCEHAREAAGLGVTAVVATAPFYAPTHPVEIERHYRAVAAAAGLPLYAYNIPSRVAGTVLGAESMVRLGTEGVLDGLKDSTGDDGGIREVIMQARDAGLPHFRVLTGSEVTVDAALRMGAAGLVPGLGNVDPHGYVRLYEHFRRGDDAALQAEQERLIRLSHILQAGDLTRMSFGSAAMGAFKAALVLRGVIACGATVAPSIPLDDEEIAAVRARLEAAGLL